MMSILKKALLVGLLGLFLGFGTWGCSSKKEVKQGAEPGQTEKAWGTDTRDNLERGTGPN